MKTKVSLEDKLLRVRSSDKMVCIISLIVGQGWVTHPRASNDISITSDGYAISGGWFIGSAADLERNVKGFIKTAELTEEEESLFWTHYAGCVTDWRGVR